MKLFFVNTVPKPVIVKINLNLKIKKIDIKAQNIFGLMVNEKIYFGLI